MFEWFKSFGKKSAPESKAVASESKDWRDESGLMVTPTNQSAELAYSGGGADMLEGSSSILEKIGGVFGFESEFLKIEKSFDAYRNEKNPEKKESSRIQLIEAGEKWLSSHSNSKTDEKKLRSVQRIVANLKSNPELVLDKLDDKISLSAKMAKFFKGEESTFSKINTLYSEFLNLQSSSLNSVPAFLNFLQAGNSLKNLIQVWESKHEGEENDKSKSLNIIKGSLGNFELNLPIQSYFSIKSSEISFEDYQASSHSVILQKSSLDVTLTKEITFSAISENIILSEKGALLKNVSFEIAKELNLGNILKVSNVKGTIDGIGSNDYSFLLEGGIQLSLEGSEYASITVGGNASVLVNGNDLSTTTSLSDAFFSLNIGALSLSAENLNYQDGLLTAETCSFKLPIFEHSIDGEISGVEVQKNSLDWELAKLSTDLSFELGDFLKISSLSGEMAGKKQNYAKKLSGNVELNLNLPGIANTKTAGDIELSNKPEDGNSWDTSISNTSLEAEILNFIKLEENNLNYSNNQLSLENPTLTFIGKAPDFLKNLSFSGENVIIDSQGVNWAEISVENKGEAFAPNDHLSFNLSKIKVLGREDNYNLEFENAEGEVNLWEYISAAGSGSFRYDQEKKKIEIIEASLSFAAEFGEIPGENPFWPVNFTLVFPLSPIGIGLEAGLSIYASGGVQPSFKGSVTYEESKPNQWQTSGEAAVLGKLLFGIKASAGIGSQFLLYLGLFLEAQAEARAMGKLTADTTISMDPSNYALSFSDTSLGYSIGADFLARLQGGVEAKAFYFFGKPLYTLVFKEWNLGSSYIEGKFDPATNTSVIENKKGVLAGNPSEIADPVKAGAITREENYSREAYDTLAKAQELLGNMENKVAIENFIGSSGIPDEGLRDRIHSKVRLAFQKSVDEAQKAKTIALKNLKLKQSPIDKEITTIQKQISQAEKSKKGKISKGFLRGSISLEELQTKLSKKVAERKQFQIEEAALKIAEEEFIRSSETLTRLNEILANANQPISDKVFSKEIETSAKIIGEIIGQ